MSKRANRPFGVIIPYGPDDQHATKLVVSVFESAGSQEPVEIKKWFCEEGDAREDEKIEAEVTDFLNRHRVVYSRKSDRILGCPHEEGIDYPLGGVCPKCPFWAQVDRFTGKRIPDTVEEVLAELSKDHEEIPDAALTGASRLRAQLAEPLIALVERGTAEPASLSDEEQLLFRYALYLLASWGETRAYPGVVRWIGLPAVDCDELTGDIATQDGAFILTSVWDGDLAPIKALIENRELDEFARGVALEALAILAAWGKTSRESVADYFRFLVREGFARDASEPWAFLGMMCIELAVDDLYDDFLRVVDEGLAGDLFLRKIDLDAMLNEPVEARIEQFKSRRPPLTDVGAAISWWNCFGDKPAFPEPEFGAPDFDEGPAAIPYVAPAKVGRNDQCPCGSGKKYKKCCGAKGN